MRDGSPAVGGMVSGARGYRRGMAITDEVQRLGEPVRRWARTQKQEYTQGEARPLGADLGAMGGLVQQVMPLVQAAGLAVGE